MRIQMSIEHSTAGATRTLLYMKEDEHVMGYY